MKNIFKKINKINEFIAKNMTLTFGSMWVCYLFMLYGLLPLFPFIAPFMPQILYWSNWIQLWSLPLIIVGTNLLGRNSEKRAKETYEMVKSELLEIKNLLKLENEQAQNLKKIIERLENWDNKSDIY